MARWGSILLLLLALGALWGIASWCYPHLPAEFPVHFDGAGKPDRWAYSTPGEWFLLPIIATGMALMFSLIALSLGWFARKYPGLVNIPQAKLFQQLEPARRQRVLAPCGLLMFWVAACLVGMFATMVWGSYQVAIKAASTLGMQSLFVVLGAILAPLGWVMWRTRTLVLLEWADQSRQSSASRE
ncbi:MAG: DUF1648 domain-containing protein [Planctomycetota bacterium]|nr:DUF1648 domain-containing protein [Planctomycetota bacterium]MDA1106752.1 DUF1648 domain-containing protein [Planctomycetota bacterium]